jgi:hypothetical protein
MKKILLTVLIATVVVGMAAAQDYGRFFENQKVRDQLSLTDKEIQDLTSIWDSNEKAMQVARADREVKASELKRLLLEDKVDMNKIQKALRDGMELEYQMRLLEIQSFVKAKEILGEKRWASLHKLLRDYMEKHRGMDRGDRHPGGPGRDFPPK